jgi:hypothetical protein
MEEKPKPQFHRPNIQVRIERKRTARKMVVTKKLKAMVRNSEVEVAQNDPEAAVKAIQAVAQGQTKGAVAEQLGVSRNTLNKLLSENREGLALARQQMAQDWHDLGAAAIKQARKRIKEASPLQAATIAGIAADKEAKLRGDAEDFTPGSVGSGQVITAATQAASAAALSEAIKILKDAGVFKKPEPTIVDVTPEPIKQ